MGDYGVLWVMRYEQAGGKARAFVPRYCIRQTHVAVGNLTAASTLALAFFAAIFADFKAVAELGWIAGCGVLLCAFACFTVLPALLMLLDKRSFNEQGMTIPGRGPEIALVSACRTATHTPSIETWLPILSRRPLVVVAAGGFATLVLGLCALRVNYDHNLLHLQARDLDSVKWEMVLIERTAGASLARGQCLQHAEGGAGAEAEFEKLPDVSRVVEVATLVPTEQDKKLPLLADMHKRLTYLPPRGARIPHAMPDLKLLQESLGALIQNLPTHAPTSGSGATQMADCTGRCSTCKRSCSACRRTNSRKSVCNSSMSTWPAICPRICTAWKR